MKNEAVEEEITLDSGEVDLAPDESGLRKITAELSQHHNRRNIKKLFRIYDKKILGVGEQNDKRKKTYLVHLALLTERPVRSFNINKNLFYLSFFSGLISCLALLLKIYGLESLPEIYTYTAIFLFAAIAIFSFYKMMKGMRNSVIFSTAHGRIPLVEILSKNPDRKQYKEFITVMKQCISRFRKDERYSGQGALSAELNEHRRLHEHGVISSKEYKLAKKNILGKH